MIFPSRCGGRRNVWHYAETAVPVALTAALLISYSARPYGYLPCEPGSPYEVKRAAVDCSMIADMLPSKLELYSLAAPSGSTDAAADDVFSALGFTRDRSYKSAYDSVLLYRSTAAQALLGAKAAPAGESGFESTYESELGTLHITRTGGFSAVMTGGSRVRSSEKAAEKLLRAMDFQYQTLTREQTEPGAVQIRPSQPLLGVPVLGSQLALTYTDDCLTAVEGTFYTGGSSITRVSEQESISAADALAQLLARRDALGWVGSAVTGLTQAYLPSDQAGTGIRFVPVWLVETDAGSFFINGITREITAET